MMVRLTIDGQIAYVKRHTPILDVAKQLGIFIPTLCHHKAVKAYGSCRLCIVEALINGRSKLVTSCNYPAEDGLVVFTANDKVKTTRKMVMELLLARCPDVPEIQQLAEKAGLKTVRFKKKGDQRCILCGLCVRVCEEVVGVSAISFVSRGTEKGVDTPFGMDSEVCIGCGSCTYVCPTGCIEMVGDPGPPGSRKMNMGDLALEPCPNKYQCADCEIDQQFLEQMKGVVERVRAIP
jgi:NADH dehydrogenase/NADH:ubiquinone oxidoreductase subunit G